MKLRTKIFAALTVLLAAAGFVAKKPAAVPVAVAAPKAAFADILPRRATATTSPSMAAPRLKYFEVAAYDDEGESPHSNEVSWGTFPAVFSWQFPEDLGDIRGFRIYFSNSPGPKTNFVDVGKMLSAVWPVPLRPVVNVWISCPRIGAAVWGARLIGGPWTFLTNAPAEKFSVAVDTQVRFFGSPSGPLFISVP